MPHSYTKNDRIQDTFGAPPRGLCPAGVGIMICVYILVSLKDGKKYTGSTTNFDRRIKEHSKGMVRSTRARRPLKVFGYQKCNTIKEASDLEKKYKHSHDALIRAIKYGLFTLETK